MIEKKVLDDGKVQVTFRISKHIWADHIALVGEFNDWDTTSHCLHQTNDDEHWHVTVELDAGRAYRFRYMLDGKEWMDDDGADGCEANPYGGFDSVVRT